VRDPSSHFVDLDLVLEGYGFESFVETINEDLVVHRDGG
jgi:hypothetical protein